MTLFVRDARRLRHKDVSKCRIVEGDVLKLDQLTKAIAGQDVVYANLAGDLVAMQQILCKRWMRPVLKG